MITNSDRIVLDALHRNARNWMTDAEWQQVEAAVVKAGGVLKVQGWERSVLEKAAKQSFGGDRSAAGRYAAQQRWARRSAGTTTTSQPSTSGPSKGTGVSIGSDGVKRIQTADGRTISLAEAAAEMHGKGSKQHKKALEQEAKQRASHRQATWEVAGKAGDEAKAAVPTKGLASPMRQKVDSAVANAEEAKRHDLKGNALQAWERSSVAAFDAATAANMKGAPKPLKRLAEILNNLMLQLTDAYYAER